MLDSHNHSEAVGHLELATGKHSAVAVMERTGRLRHDKNSCLCTVTEDGVGFFSFAKFQQDNLGFCVDSLTAGDDGSTSARETGSFAAWCWNLFGPEGRARLSGVH